MCFAGESAMPSSNTEEPSRGAGGSVGEFNVGHCSHSYTGLVSANFSLISPGFLF